ncbi:hypothetical protein UK82_11380 [Frankia sp. ACN1ag]|nr:hypothetical protein UK82_11380 [Frankia sp. ACN1ag]
MTVVGIGNRCRHDDAVGLVVVRRLQGRFPLATSTVEGLDEPAGLFAAWDGAHGVWIIDAARCAAAPGTVFRFRADERPLPAQLIGPSTHTLSVADAVEIGRALGGLPRFVVVHAIVGRDFSRGEGLDPDVAAAARGVAATVRAEVARWAARYAAACTTATGHDA